MLEADHDDGQRHSVTIGWLISDTVSGQGYTGAVTAPRAPEPMPHSALVLDEILTMKAFQAGAPELISAARPVAERSDPVPVRWIHVAETLEATTLLEGGEFVLSTGRLLDGPASAEEGVREAERMLDELEAAQVAAVAVEVLPEREEVARALAQAAAHRSLPVYRLSRQVRFVAITQEVHRRISERQFEQLTTDRRIHDVFTDLSLEAAPAPRIVEEAGKLLGTRVHWHRDAEGPSSGIRDGGPAIPQVPVVVAGEPAGVLAVEVPERGPVPPRELCSTVLERAAQAVALGLLTERSRQDQARQAESTLLHELRRPWHLEEDEALRRARALGIGVVRGRPEDGPVPAAWVPVVLRWDAGRRTDREVLDALTWSLRQARTTALAGRLNAAGLALLIPVAARALEGSVLERVLGGVRRRLGAEAGSVAGAGPAEPLLLTAAARLDEAAMVAEAAEALGSAPGLGPVGGDDARAGARRTYYRARDVRLRGLLASLRGDERVRQFAAAELEPVLGPERTADLELLERLLASGGNKSALAQSLNVSRPALYARLARLQRRLEVSLEDPESLASLQVALLVHRLHTD